MITSPNRVTAMNVDRDSCDIFSETRNDGAATIEIAGEPIVMLTNWRAVRDAARDWRTFSSDAPFRVPIPAEDDVRSVRQLPIETDPPAHTDLRRQLEPWFRRPAEPAFQAALDHLIGQELAAAIDRSTTTEPIEFVRDFIVPLQSRALALLLNTPMAEADTWIGWGVHVFRDGDDGPARGAGLHAYLEDRIAAACATPGEDFFSALTRMTFDNRPLTTDEMIGVANLTFAGGRDTLINAIASMIVWFADRRETLDAVAKDQRSINLAVEEFVRALSPLAHIGRVCKAGASVGAHDVAADGRASLCWAAANHDPSVFEDPGAVKVDRSPNPHVGFGSGHHACLGATHARAVLRVFIKRLSKDTARIDIDHAEPQIETIGPFQRRNGYDQILGRFA